MCSHRRGRPWREDIVRPRCLNPACLLVGFFFGFRVVCHDTHLKDELMWRFKCLRCGRTFNKRTWTPLSRLRTPVDDVVRALKCYCHGMNVSDIADVFDVQDKTVKKWIQRVVKHCDSVVTYQLYRKHHTYTPLYVQLDELWSFEWTRKHKLWAWIGFDASSKLFIAFHVGERTADSAVSVVKLLWDRIHSTPRLVTSDGLDAYVEPVLSWFCGVVYAQVVKRRERNRVVEVLKHVVSKHTLDEVHDIISKLEIGATVNTAYVERFNLTLRRGLGSLNRKTLSACKDADRLRGDLTLFQAYYNLVRPHMSLTLGVGCGRVIKTPAQAAGLTDHPWTWIELLTNHVHQKNPKRRIA